MKSNGLSIVIPTFNREKQLEKQLRLIVSSNIELIEEVVVIDNCSQYNIECLLESISCNKIRLVKQPFNVKVHNNIARAFAEVRTEWMWLLSDDDEIDKNAIDSIWIEISEAPLNIGLIKFARHNSQQKNFLCSTLVDFIDYYYQEKVKRRGDLVFISTNVFNVKNISNYLSYAFEYAYTYVPHLVPVIKGLNDSEFTVLFSDLSIVKYLPPREGWYSFGTVGKGLSTLSHIPLNVSKKYKKKFLNITMSITYLTLIRGFLNNDKIDKLDDFKIIYNNIYRYYISTKGKIVVLTFFAAMNCAFTRKITFAAYKFIKKLK